MTDATAFDYLPRGAQGQPRITIPLPGLPKGRPAPTPTTGSDPWADLSTDYIPSQSQGAQINAAQGAQVGDPWADVSADYEPAAPPKRQVGTGEAVLRGGIDAATFGLAPAMVGVTEAAKALPPDQRDVIPPTPVATEFPGMDEAGAALANLFSKHPDPAVRDAYERGRQDVIENQDMAREQHPLAYIGGQMTGAMMLPIGGAAAPGTAVARMARGAVAGGAGAGAYAAGTDVSREAPLPELVEDTAKGTGLGMVLGGATGGVLGPRLKKPPVTSGQRAAETASNLGAALPRGVVSDRPFIQDTTAAAQSVPLTGTKITQGVKRTEAAAGEYTGDVADQMTRGVNDRAASDVIVRPGMQQVVQDNKAAIDAAYDGVRGAIDRNARFTMPRTGEAIDKVVEARRRAGWANPEEGLGDFMNIAISPAKSAALQRQAQALYAKAKAMSAAHPGAGAAEKAKADALMAESRRGTTFEGAHRARSDAANKGNPAAPHPGYDAADFNRIREAMKGDLRHMLAAAAQAKGSNPQRVLAEFDRVEKAFGPLKEANELLDRLVNAKGEGSIAALLGATKEKGGDFRLLLQLKNKMPPREFEQIGGMVLNELGANPSRVGGKDFSLAKFVTEWNKLSDRAKQILFDPQHLRNIEDIVSMGEHIKGALAKSNTSHTGGVFILYELLNASIEASVSLSTGGMSAGQFATAAAGAMAPMVLAGWLAIPKNAASMAKFSRAWQTFVVSPSPARIGVLTAAARNMANTLGLEPGTVLKALQSRIQGALPGRAEDQGGDQQQ